MKRLLLLALLMVPFLAFAQEQQGAKQTYSIEIDAKSLTPVQTDALSGVAIDKIGRDSSQRPCARIKMHINRMTRKEIDQLIVKPIGGNIEVMKKVVAAEGNGLIIELTAKQPTRFYLHHDKYGDSNEVSLNLEGNKEYRINAQLNYLHTIFVGSNTVNADVYIDDEFKGKINSDYSLTINDVIPGQHKIRVQDGSLRKEEMVEVSGSRLSFRIELDQAIPPTKPPVQHKPSRVSPIKPEKFTMEMGAIFGTNCGFHLDFTTSYLLIGAGVDWVTIIPKITKNSVLVNSGYIGNFSKKTTINLSGSCTNIFLDIGGYFKYFSVSCQVGVLCGTVVERLSLYDGSGYGIKDGDIDEYWGSYIQKSFTHSTSNKELHMTLTPQIKGYIPLGRKSSTLGNFSISLGLGYTFVPTLGCCAGLSGNLGWHIRF